MPQKQFGTVMRFFRIAIAIIITIFSIGNAKGQPSIAHSQPNTPLHDSTLIKNNIKLAAQLQKTRPDTALLLLQTAIAQSRFQENYPLLINALFTVCEYYEAQGLYDSSIASFIQAIAYVKKPGCAHFEGKIYNNLGVLCKLLGRFEDAQTYLLKSLAFNEAAGNAREVAKNLNNIGTIYIGMGDLKNGFAFLKRSLTHGLPQELAIRLNNIGDYYEKINQLDSAKVYYLNALQTEKNETGNRKIGGTICLNLGNINFKEGNTDSAFYYYRVADSIGTANNNKRLLCRNYAALADTYLKLNRLSTSIAMANKGLAIAKAMSLPTEHAMVLDLLYKAHLLHQNYDSALIYLEQYKVINDSLVSTEKLRIVNNLQKKYDAGKKERELVLLTKEKELNTLRITASHRALLVAKEQAEAQRLIGFAMAEKDRHVADSLYHIAAYHLLKAQQLKAEEEKNMAANQANLASIKVLKREAAFRWYVIVGALLVMAVVLPILWFVYQSWRRQRRAKQTIAQQKTQIEALYNNLEHIDENQTRNLALRKQEMESHAFFNAHVLRRPLVNIEGLISVYQKATNADVRKAAQQHLITSFKELIQIIDNIKHKKP
jgi:tetratricopeptide (TPR) repeat protein